MNLANIFSPSAACIFIMMKLGGFLINHVDLSFTDFRVCVLMKNYFLILSYLKCSPMRSLSEELYYFT